MVKPPPGTTKTAAPFRFEGSGIKVIMAGLSSSDVPVAPGAPSGQRRIVLERLCETAGDVMVAKTKITKRYGSFIGLNVKLKLQIVSEPKFEISFSTPSPPPAGDMSPH
jgi:hypothetical protein